MILRSFCTDPRWNLALEERLMELEKPLLYLWQNEPSVIIGRNQNPHRECRLLPGVHLVRRRSGGGAVYHDLGNLNFTILSTKHPQVVEENFTLVQKVLGSLGIFPEVSGRNDLELHGQKISGSAFFENERIFCHHGTLLVDVDRQAMEQCLTVSTKKLRSKGIDSVRARVCNLREFAPSITVEAIVSAFSAVLGEEIRGISLEELKASPEIREKAEKYGSWDWTYGECPPYNWSVSEKFSWGLVQAEIFVESGKITACKLYTDSLSTEEFPRLSQALVGKSGPEIGAEVRRCIPDAVMQRDLLGLLQPSISVDQKEIF